jgi:PilZ domain
MTPFTVDARLQPPFKLGIDIRIHSPTCGVLMGRTLNISESGIAAILRIEVFLDEVVKLDFPLPLGHVTVYAVGRQRNAFRYGFEFVESNSEHEIIRHTCRDLAVDEALIWKDG